MDKYEKLYNEALERAKKELAACGSMDCDAARQIFRLFPQLCESEDERIIEEIKFAVMQMPTERQDTKERCIAWLEKQKEQKPIQSEYEKKYIRTIKSLISDFLRGKRDIDTEYYQKIYDWLDGRHVEQKPAPISCSHENGAEWNEEDEKIRKTLLDYYEEALDNYTCVEWMNGITYGELCDWLKSLPEKFNLQQKQEWSEEDDMLMDELESYILYDKEFNDEQKLWRIKRLKSLRPVSKESLQSHWKPSEEQMDALKELIDYANRAGWVTPGATELADALIAKLKEK